MALTRNKKRIKAERKSLGINLCCKCSDSMKGQSHHFYCNKCYVPKYLRIGRRGDWNDVAGDCK